MFIPGGIPETVMTSPTGEGGQIWAAVKEEARDSVEITTNYTDTSRIGFPIWIEGNRVVMEESICNLAQGETQEIEDRVIPLAELSSGKNSGDITWRGFLLVFLAMVILGVGIWAVLKSKGEKSNRKYDR